MSEDADRPPIDLDQVIELVLLVGGVAFYFVGAAYGAFLLGGWMGAFALVLFGAPPIAYRLARAADRRAERERREEFEASRERTNHDALTIDLPGRH